MKSNAQEIDASRMISSTLLVMTVHTLIPLFWIVLAIFILPKFLSVFSEMNAPLPLLTRIFFKAFSFLSHFWYLFIFVFFWILVADGAVYYLLLRRLEKIYSFLYSIAIVLAEGALTVLYIIMLFLPMAKIIRELEG
jgi:type II secretory pathway component PulF